MVSSVSKCGNFFLQVLFNLIFDIITYRHKALLDLSNTKKKAFTSYVLLFLHVPVKAYKANFKERYLSLTIGWKYTYV